MAVKDLEAELQLAAAPKEVQLLQSFFKTGAGQYGEGDVFIGIRVPQIRKICASYRDVSLEDIQQLLHSEIHEFRLAALILTVSRFKTADDFEQEKIYELYLRNVREGRVNNWDLVDSSAEFIVGQYLLDRPRDVLYTLATSTSIWEKRVSMIATFQFIKSGDASTSLEIAELLLQDLHDLLQKAVGWMLREVGKRVDEKLLLSFLDINASQMPRTTLRYAIERLSGPQKTHYMAAKINRQTF